jgi:hypothetical protein
MYDSSGEKGGMFGYKTLILSIREHIDKLARVGLDSWSVHDFEKKVPVAFREVHERESSRYSSKSQRQYGEPAEPGA